MLCHNSCHYSLCPIVVTVNKYFEFNNLSGFPYTVYVIHYPKKLDGLMYL